jgi:thymidylate synthase (FAD)
MIIERGHESVLEHASASIRFICDRGVSHEIVRHRIASFSQESTRYVNYTNSENIGFIIPSWLDLPEGVFKLDQLWKEKDTGAYTWLCAISDSEKAYRDLIGAGWKPEQARSVLPNSLKTEIVMTGNFREWRHFFKLRDAAPAHPQMSQVAAKAHVLLRYAVPVVFE